MIRLTAPAILLLTVHALGVGFVAAQWSDDPSINLAIADRSGGQTIPLVGSTSDGKTYVAWFDPAAGSYDVYLQLLDVGGVEQWPHNGILVSDHPQDTALFGWDMIVDSADNAVIVFSDTRDGGDLDIHAYRVDQTGQMLWGADGVTLSSNSDFEPAPRVTEASDGDFVFVWMRNPNTGDGDLRMQRLSPDGDPRLFPGGIAVVQQSGETPGFAEIAPAEDGNVIVSWVRDISSFPSPRHVRARKFRPNGLPAWFAHVNVYDAFSVPIGYYPQIMADGAGGAFLLWHRSDGAFFNAFVQHLDAAGTELFAHNGVAVSTTGGMHHLDPAFSPGPEPGELIVFWNERISNQSQWGIRAQRFSALGLRMWGAGGVELLPVNTTWKSPPRSVPYAGGAGVFLVDTPGSNDRIIGIRVDADGNPVWPGSPVVVSDRASGKSRYPVTIAGNDVAVLVWEDDKGTGPNVYGQNVNPDGTLGVSPSPGHITDDILVGRSTRAPGDLIISWTESCAPGAVDYAIYEGTMGSFYSHAMRVCSDEGGDLLEEIQPDPASSYYLVVPIGPEAEGSHGTDSDGEERPAALPENSCMPDQDTSPCPR